MADAVEFVDEATLHARGGRGGDGATSFRREAHVPRGGPDGGNGGRGGDVVLLADEDTTSLIDLHRAPHRRAEKGVRGEGNRKEGRNGRDEVVRVPVGTVVHDRETGEVLADLVEDGQRAVVAQGGRGGRGNAAFATKHRRIPRFHEHGETVPETLLRLELKLIADVGLVGYPSAGKSSLIRALSSATPRVEAWPFTTLTPHLGVMRAGEGDPRDVVDVVLADVPGLVEGAAEGRGLGHQFLRHIERCRVLLHVLDAAPFDPDRDPARDLATMRDELRRYDPAMLDRPEVVVLNKIDLPDGRAMAELVGEQLADRMREIGATTQGDDWEDGEPDPDVLLVSALTGEGLGELRWRLASLVGQAPRTPRTTDREDDGPVVLRPLRARDDVVVGRHHSGAFEVTSRRVERWVSMLPTDNREAMRYLAGRLRRAGVEKQLIRAGARAGDDVVIGDLVMSFTPDPRDLPEDEREAALAAERAADAADDPVELPGGIDAELDADLDEGIDDGFDDDLDDHLDDDSWDWDDWDEVDR